MNKLFKLCILSAALLSASPAFSEPLACGAKESAAPSALAPIPAPAHFVPGKEESSSKSPAELLEEASRNFKTRYPKTKVNSFRLTPIPGIYEAAVAKEVAYFDISARYVFTGRILDMEKGEDITQARLRDIRRIDFDSLPLDKAVKTVKGTGERRLAVFTDVDCPFSRKLAKTLDELKDVTIYTFLFPLTSIHPEAHAKSETIWCARDSEGALKIALEGKPLDNVSKSPFCEAPTDEIIRLAASHGIGGTPSLINAAGNRTAGALPLAQLEAFIGEKAPESKKKGA